MNVNVDFKELKARGYLNMPVPAGIDLVEEILRLKREKNAVILGHYYIEGPLQDIADFVGDSLQLAQQAAKTQADLIVFLGVHFMAETAKILSPSKKVLLPDLQAGCSLADSCPTEAFADFVARHPGHTVVSYVNTTADIKALTDIICTSSNAVAIIESLPKDEKIIFAPDRNLGNYIAAQTGRAMVIWDGACHVHQQFSLERLIELKRENPQAKILAHPECNKTILMLADFIGSTSALLKFSQTDDAQAYLVATESGILHQMRRASPAKTFIAAPPEDSTCACNDCSFMKLNNLGKLYNCLKYELPEITLDPEVSRKAYGSIRRMLDISERLGL